MNVSEGWEPPRKFRTKSGNCVVERGHPLTMSPRSLVARGSAARSRPRGSVARNRSGTTHVPKRGDGDDESADGVAGEALDDDAHSSDDDAHS
eukprot:2126631-Alexandrium_andersonii.AAC.1